MNIHGKYVTLRAIEREDLSLLHKWGNDPEIWYGLGGWHFPSSADYMEKWFSDLKHATTKQNFAIETKVHGLIGTVNLGDINWKDRNAFTGIQLGDKEMRGKGYGIDSIMTLQRYAFEELQLHRLDTTMIEYNVASLNVYLGKCGWKEEGRQREWYFRKNRYWDRVMVGITRADYFELVEKNGYWKAGKDEAS